MQKFRYTIPLPTLLIGCTVSFLSIEMLIKDTIPLIQTNKNITIFELIAVGLHLCMILIPVLFVYLIYKFFRPGDLIINENSVGLPLFRFFNTKTIIIPFNEIKSSWWSQSGHCKCLHLETCEGEFTIRFDLVNKKERVVLAEFLAQKLHHLSEESNHRQEIEDFKRKRLSVIGIVVGVVSLIFLQYFDRQVERDIFILVSFLLSGLLVTIFLHFEKNKTRKSERYSLIIILVYVLTPFLCFLNQSFDNSKPDMKVISVIKLPSEQNNKGNCFLINYELIKNDPDWYICDKRNPTLTETSLVEVSMKQGKLGKRWIASIKLLDKNGETEIQRE